MINMDLLSRVLFCINLGEHYKDWQMTREEFVFVKRRLEEKEFKYIGLMKK